MRLTGHVTTSTYNRTLSYYDMKNNCRFRTKKPYFLRKGACYTFHFVRFGRLLGFWGLAFIYFRKEASSQQFEDFLQFYGNMTPPFRLSSNDSANALYH